MLFLAKIVSRDLRPIAFPNIKKLIIKFMIRLHFILYTFTLVLKLCGTLSSR